MSRAVSDTSNRLSVLETQVETLSQNVVKLEEKMDSNYAVLHHRISEMRDDFQKSIDDKHEKLISRLDTQAQASTQQHQALSSKINSLEKWRWMIMGAAIVVGYILAHIKIEKLF